MSERQTKRVYVDIKLNDNGGLFYNFKKAWLNIPNEYKDSAEIWDNQITYERFETDSEYADRQETERLEAEASSKFMALRQKSHIVNELHGTINAALSNINNDWAKISTGQDVKMIASVPMPDGRLAGIEIKIIAREQTVSHD